LSLAAFQRRKERLTTDACSIPATCGRRARKSKLGAHDCKLAESYRRYGLGWISTPIGSWCWQRASVLNRSVATAESEPILGVHQDEGWRLHQPAKLRQGGFQESGMWPFLRQKFSRPPPALVTNEGSMTAITPDHHHGSLITRRSIFIGAAASLICAPAIVRTASLMPVRALRGPIGPQYAGFVERLMYAALDSNLRAGRMSTVLNGEIISKTRARRMVAHARAQGWLPPEAAYSQSAWSLRKNT
jgi:hypothetical protein